MKINTLRPRPFPTTVAELQRIADGDPGWARVVLPSRDECDRLGLKFNAPPMTVQSRERFLSTLAEDPEFARAVRKLIGGVE